ncbi:MAG: hypothetical protein J6I35_04615 [Ruminobacter sp.]|uniref:hypothetical protein n=1 Tax=Ruminobacter sp. TaxID=2774296 RepID=UPI001B72FCD1|nr:hypothetical protein [Ruminobacter sp.]MBP3748820.1 hypothetical protein [Ruminobacter sp.]
MKKILSTAITASMLALATPAYSSGFPTIDIAQVTQQLIAYLQMIDDYEVMLNQQLNQIEHLQQIEVPGLAEYKRLQELIFKYQETAQRYNSIAKKYNSLSKFLKQFEDIEFVLQNNCSQGYQCSAEDLNILNTKKIELIKNMDEVINASLDNTQKEKQAIEADLETFNQTAGKSANTQGEIDQKMISLLVLLNKQIAELRQAQANRNETEATLQKYRSYDENSEKLRRIGTRHD